MAVQDIIKGAVTVQKLIKGIKAAHADAPSALNQLPCFVTYPAEGSRKWPREPNLRRVTHNFDMDLYVQEGGDISAADRILKPYIDIVMDTFDQHITLGGVVWNSAVVDYKYGKLEYAGTEYLGIKFTFRAVEIKTVNYSG